MRIALAVVVMLAIGVSALQVRAVKAQRGEDNLSLETLGSVLPAVTLRSAGGADVPLRRRAAGQPHLVLVFGAKDCLSCSSYPMELRILQREIPGLRAILIGSGADQPAMAKSFHDSGLDSIALFDPQRALLTALHMRNEPLALLTDADGRVLFVDTRSTSAAAQFPLGRLLPLLERLLRVSRDTVRVVQEVK